VRAISSGTPEVNNYPFTTRGITLGHVQVFWASEDDVARGVVAGVSVPSEKKLVQERLLKGRARNKDERRRREASVRGGDEGAHGAAGGTSETRETVQPPLPSLSPKTFPISQLCQIMDSPGLLRRDDAALRNEMEELTLAAMAHLPTAVMYVLDLSGGAGDRCSSVEDQLTLRQHVRARFPRRPWIDVVAKADLGVAAGARERLERILAAEERGDKGGSESHLVIELSVKEGRGLDELRQEVMRMLGEVRVVLDAMAAVDKRSARAI